MASQQSLVSRPQNAIGVYRSLYHLHDRLHFTHTRLGLDQPDHGCHTLGAVVLDLCMLAVFPRAGLKSSLDLIHVAFSQPALPGDDRVPVGRGHRRATGANNDRDNE